MDTLDLIVWLHGQRKRGVRSTQYCLTLFLTLVCCQRPSECAHDATTFRCVEFVRNYDGDTVTFNIPGAHPLIGSEVSVRIRGIDTPEIRTKNRCEKDKAKEAQLIVQTTLKSARRIDLVNVARDKYFRILADVQIDGKTDLAALIKSRNLARDYDGGTKQQKSWCDF